MPTRAGHEAPDTPQDGMDPHSSPDPSATALSTRGSSARTTPESPRPPLMELLPEDLSEDTLPQELPSILERAFAQTMAMVHVANHRKDKRPGDPKVGGHPASCASASLVLGALHLVVREPEDFVCCKPHASPVDHALHHLLGLFRDGDGRWLEDAERERAMLCLRKFAEDDFPHVFQSYHAKSDPDHFHFLPSGSVGIPPVNSVYLALAYRYAADHGWKVNESAHFWSLMGDSEFREGSLFECMPEAAERGLGNVTWIVDYNRQNLDGTRTPDERILGGTDGDRIERTAAANGWDVLQLRHGRYRDEIFGGDGGPELRALLEGKMPEYVFQMLMLKGDADLLRRYAEQFSPGSEKALAPLADEDVVRVFADLGGHDPVKVVAALRASKRDAKRPCLLILHTVKGHGLECAFDPANHSTLPSQEEIDTLLGTAGLGVDRPFEPFGEGTPEAAFLAQRGQAFREGMARVESLRDENRVAARERMEAAGGVPESLEIDLSLFPVAHTQWMWGQLANKLVRIGTTEDAELNELEQRFKPAADYVMTLSPDVGTSTNIQNLMNDRVYGPEDDRDEIERAIEVSYRHPGLVTSRDEGTRHLRFEIAEANCMSAVGSFGKMAHYMGLPFFPIMTVYDFFLKRALDQLYYDLYWRSEFVILGTPSGVNLSSEGAQHSWKSDIQMPNLITWEPLFAREVDWILCDALQRQMEDRNEGRRGVLIRAVTRAIPQKTLIQWVGRQAWAKGAGAEGVELCPADADESWGQATRESELATLPEDQLLARVREHSLAGGYHLIDWRGYAGYTPGENVVNIFVMGSVATEAIEASEQLLDRGVFGNVIVVSSPELLLGILGEFDGYAHLREGLGINGDLHGVPSRVDHGAELLSIAGRRVPAVAVCDGEAGLLDNIGSVVGVRQKTLAVRRFAKCSRPDQAFAYQELDAPAIVDAVGEVLSETAFEDLVVGQAALDAAAGRPSGSSRPDWRELWPDPPGAN